ncbi:hypothetical protein SELMODRAFT_426884 [Selaginella moellendorffii]|uniref:Amino acid transporter transmembrane domain-containing protein n=1 Tax=Selaginella moellendorffii TaxID=88036 RepID=D8SXT8_SELML|nr:hypothetical protein SELMODRAFT_426884 [Selaginella moellendorffii]
MRASLSARDQQVGGTESHEREDRMSNAASYSVFRNCQRRILRPEHSGGTQPFTSRRLWAPGMMMLGVSWIITLATMYQLIEMHEDEKAFGDRLGFIVGLQQIVVQVAANIAYLVTGGQALKRFGDLVLSREIQYGKFELAVAWISAFAGVQAVLSLFASLSSMTIVSLVAAIMSFSYSTIIWAIAIRLKSSQVSYGYCNWRYYRASNALGEIAFAYGGHNVALEIQATMRSTRHKPSKLPMWNGVLVAYVMVAVCYFPVAGVGYWALGNLTCYENVLDVLDKPKWLIGTANLMLMLHLTGSYQDLRVGCGDHTFVWRASGIIRWARSWTNNQSPCIMWLSIKKPRVLGLEWLLNWVKISSFLDRKLLTWWYEPMQACILFGVVLTIVSRIGSIVNLKHGFEEENLKVFYFPRLQQCNSTSTNAICPVRH